MVEVKTRLSGMRGVRDALVQLVKPLAASPEKRAYLLLIDPKISEGGLEYEVAQFKSAIRSDVAERLYLVIARNGEIDRAPSGTSPTDWALLRRWVSEAANAKSQLPRPDLQSEVLRVLLRQWVMGLGPVTHKWLQETVGCVYRTANSMVEKLGPEIETCSDGRIHLRQFPVGIWPQILADAPRSRSTTLFVDRSDQPRSLESLLRRIQRLSRRDVAVGGVLGAKRLLSGLDIVGVPRLDLSIHAPEGQADTEFINALDPGLKRTTDFHQPARLALHFLRRESHLFEEGSDGMLWADPIECLLDLYEARLDIQARQFSDYLEGRGMELDGEAR